MGMREPRSSPDGRSHAIWDPYSSPNTVTLILIAPDGRVSIHTRRDVGIMARPANDGTLYSIQGFFPRATSARVGETLGLTIPCVDQRFFVSMPLPWFGGPAPSGRASSPVGIRVHAGGIPRRW